MLFGFWPSWAVVKIRSVRGGAVRLSLALFLSAACVVLVGGEEAAAGNVPTMGKITGTVVVPAYKENPNIRPLAQRLFAALREHSLHGETELLIVDDNSRDGSEETVEQLRKEGVPVRIIVRTRERGLSSAVLRGFDDALGERVICMDGDLQHPPEKVPLLLKSLAEGNEFALGTRYGEGFDVDPSWPWYRVVISKGARLLARPLTPLSDPMSGFFGMTKAALRRGAGSISPVGFKIALELYVKCGVRRHGEVNIFFAKREHGESKLTGKVMLYYLVHLQQLYRFKHPLGFPFFLLFVCALAATAVYLLASIALAGPKYKTN